MTIKGSSVVRGWVGLFAVVMVALWAASAAAQPITLRVVQSSDGTLYLVQGASAWTLAPDPISDADLAGLNPVGEIDGSISPQPGPLQVVQASDGEFYVVNGQTAWTLVPDPIGDADLAALGQNGELDGAIPAVLLSPPAPAPDVSMPTPVAATPVPPVPAAPGFAGHQLQLDVYNPFNQRIGGPYTVTPAPGAQFTNLPGGQLPGFYVVPVNIAVTNSTLTFDFAQTGQYTSFPSSNFNGYVFTTSQDSPPILDVTIDPSTTLKLDESRVFASTKQIQINVQDLSFNTQTTVKLNVKFGQVSGSGLAGHQLQLVSYSPTTDQYLAGPFTLRAVPGHFDTLPAPTLVPVDINTTNTTLEFAFGKTSGYSQFASAPFNGYVFTTSAGTPAITGISIDPSTTLGLDNSRVSSTSNQIRVNVQGLAFTTRTTAKINLRF